MVIFRIIGGIGVGVASVIAPCLHRRDLTTANPRPARFAATAGDRDRHLPVVRDQLPAAWPVAREVLWFGLDAWRWMFLVMAVPAVVYGVLAFTIPESPRYLVAKYRIPEARKVLSVLLGEKSLEGHDHQDPGIAEVRKAAVVAGFEEADWWHLRNRVGGPGTFGVPAVRRYQRDLLLFQHPLGGSGIRRERGVHHHRHHVGDQHRDNIDRNRVGRQGGRENRCC